MAVTFLSPYFKQLHQYISAFFKILKSVQHVAICFWS